jgi:hypothetical protein
MDVVRDSVDMVWNSPVTLWDSVDMLRDTGDTLGLTWTLSKQVRSRFHPGILLFVPFCHLSTVEHREFRYHLEGRSVASPRVGFRSWTRFFSPTKRILFFWVGV